MLPPNFFIQKLIEDITIESSYDSAFLGLCTDSGYNFSFRSNWNFKNLGISHPLLELLSTSGDEISLPDLDWTSESLCGDILTVHPGLKSLFVKKISLSNGRIALLGLGRFRSGDPTEDDINRVKSTSESIEVFFQSVEETNLTDEKFRIYHEISHELKNPLTVIICRTRVLLEKVSIGDISNDEFKTELEKLLQCENRLAHIIDGFKLNQSEIEKQSLVKCNLKAIVVEVLESLGLNKTDKNFSLSVSIPEELNLRVVPILISQIISNLVSNSLEAILSEERSWIEIRAFFEDGFVYLEVIDSGKGIKSSVVPFLMKPFVTTKVTGTGLGLSISKRLAQRHGGDLSYISDRKNTTFRLKLPI